MFYCPYSSDPLEYYRMPSQNAFVRILHASPNAPAVDIYVNDKLFVKGIRYKGFSKYYSVPAGTYSVKAYPAGQRVNPVLSTTVTISTNTIQTIAAIGTLPNISIQSIPEPKQQIIPSKAYVRFVHLSPNAPRVDVGVAGGAALFKNVGYKEVTSYIPVDSGFYTFEVRATGTGERVLHVPNIHLLPNRFYTVYAVGLAGSTPPLQVLVPLDGNTYLKFR